GVLALVVVRDAGKRLPDGVEDVAAGTGGLVRRTVRGGVRLPEAHVRKRDGAPWQRALRDLRLRVLAYLLAELGESLCRLDHRVDVDTGHCRPPRVRRINGSSVDVERPSYLCGPWRRSAEPFADACGQSGRPRPAQGLLVVPGTGCGPGGSRIPVYAGAGAERRAGGSGTPGPDRSGRAAAAPGPPKRGAAHGARTSRPSPTDPG